MDSPPLPNPPIQSTNTPQSTAAPTPSAPSPQPPSSKSPLLFVVTVLLLAALGYLGYQNWQLQQQVKRFEAIIQVDNEPYDFSSPTPASDQTANWQTYTTESLGFSFKYPPEWTPEPTTLHSVSLNTGIPSWATMSNGNNQVYVFDAFIEEPINYENWSQQSTYLGEETIANNRFEKYIVADMYYSLNYIYKAANGKIIRFLLFPYDANQYPDTLKQDIHQILSTFKFTD
ncbi:MAG: hypothetical protein HYS86_05230 [Candidatus Chisholmbacteria bacterium]|nr:hypothetical protein [Candidatus Chisholmbacteria bacterium]